MSPLRNWAANSASIGMEFPVFVKVVLAWVVLQNQHYLDTAEPGIVTEKIAVISPAQKDWERGISEPPGGAACSWLACTKTAFAAHPYFHTIPAWVSFLGYFPYS